MVHDFYNDIVTVMEPREGEQAYFFAASQIPPLFSTLHNNYQLCDKVEVTSGVYFQATKLWGKYPLLATDTEVKSCFSLYENSEIT